MAMARSNNSKPLMAARSVIFRCGIDRIEELIIEDMAFMAGLRIRTVEMEGADGRLVRDGARGIASISSRVTNEGQKRFIMAHEFGHYEMHKGTRIFSCHKSNFGDWSGKNVLETEANRFAAALLMPDELFRNEAKKYNCSTETIRQLAQTFRVSISSASIRYAKLDMAPCSVVYSEHGTVKWSFSSDSAKYKAIRNGTAVHSDSGAAECFEGVHTLNAEETPCSAWYLDSHLKKGDSCFEQCIPMPKYSGVLSLIWTE